MVVENTTRSSIRRRAAIVGIAALFGCFAMALAGCLPDTGAPPMGDAFQGPLFTAVNRDRANAGLPALTWSPKLANLAGSHSCDMSRSYALFHSDLQSLLTSSDYAAYDVMRENVIVAPPGSTPEQLESAWMNSELHRANILAGDVNVVGMNECFSADGFVWATEEFGNLTTLP
jgi:uncharacterized protein YkwD